MRKHTVGVDVSKDYLEAYWAPVGEAKRFTNDAAGLRALIAWLDPRVERVAYEPSGPWHRAFEDALLEAGAPLYLVNPYQVRCYARATGQRTKTDPVDARVLASMAESIKDLRPLRARSQTQKDLVELRLAREGLMRDRTALLNRRSHLRQPLLKRLNQNRLLQIERQLRSIDQATRELVESDAELARRVEILTSIPGISELTATGLITYMPELGSLTGPAAASLAGLAPITRESGSWRGHSFIQGGRPQVRRLLFMPAMVASRYNPDLSRKYRSLRAAGKAPKVALTALMRKLIVLANVLLQQDRLWTPPQLPTPA